MDVLPWVFSSGWASGINGYAVVLLLGLLGRFAGTDGVPPALERTDVLIVAGLLCALDLVADKIPYVDSVWDAVHTAIRPAIGAAVGALLAGQAGSLNEAVAAGTGGITALVSQLVKSGLRVAVNTSPEPASNILVSSAEDITVGSVVAVSAVWLWVAAVVAAALLTGGLILVIVLGLLAQRLRGFRRDQRERQERRE
jgi:hypothetical protein